MICGKRRKDKRRGAKALRKKREKRKKEKPSEMGAFFIGEGKSADVYD